MTAPNTTLQAVRRTMLMSQGEFADELQRAADKHGDHIAISLRTVQRWEAGTTTNPRPAYARALRMVTRLPVEHLGFPAAVDRLLVEDGRGGHDLEVRATPQPADPPHRPAGDYSGIWQSRYEYFSSGRDGAYEGLHTALLLHFGDQLTVRSLAGSAASAMSMDLNVDGHIAEGTWAEHTEPGGYYRGARYHGAIQLLADPTGRRLAGKWVGFGKDGDINTGPWTLTFLDASTSRAAVERYNRPLEEL